MTEDRDIMLCRRGEHGYPNPAPHVDVVFYPLGEAMVERLARAGYARYWQAVVSEAVAPDEEDLRHWSAVVRAIFRELMEEAA